MDTRSRMCHGGWSGGTWGKCRYLHIYIYHISFMELGHLLTPSGLTYPEVSSKVYRDSFCQLGSSVSLPWVIYCEAFYLHRMPRNRLTSWFILYVVLTGCQQPVNTTHYYTNCCLYRVDPSDDEQEACSKYVEAYYWNNL